MRCTFPGPCRHNSDRILPLQWDEGEGDVVLRRGESPRTIASRYPWLSAFCRRRTEIERFDVRYRIARVDKRTARNARFCPGLKRAITSAIASPQANDKTGTSSSNSSWESTRMGAPLL